MERAYLCKTNVLSVYSTCFILLMASLVHVPEKAPPVLQVGLISRQICIGTARGGHILEAGFLFGIHVQTVCLTGGAILWSRLCFDSQAIGIEHLLSEIKVFLLDEIIVD